MRTDIIVDLHNLGRFNDPTMWMAEIVYHLREEYPNMLITHLFGSSYILTFESIETLAEFKLRYL